jgi:hypothetical protein
MSKGESDALAEKISRAARLTANVPVRNKPIKKGKKLVCPGRKTVRREPIVKLDPIYYGTDATDDDTDWSDF